MSAPDPSFHTFWITSLIAAVAGGWHCAGMCGPLAALAAGPRARFLHQLGRLISYVTLGFVAGATGLAVSDKIPTEWRVVLLLATGLFAFVIVYFEWGVGLLIPAQVREVMRRIRRLPQSMQFLSLGLINGFIPCGWLLGFLFVATGLRSGAQGAALLFALWLGSLPWLVGFSLLGRELRLIRSQHPWVSIVLFGAVVLGLVAQSLNGLGGS